MAAGGYETWLAAALWETEDRARWGASWHAAPRRAVAEMGAQERAPVALARVVAALAVEARIEATIDAAACAAWLAADCARDDAARD